VAGDLTPVVAAVLVRVRRLAAEERFEEAAVHRDRLRAVVRAAARSQRLAALVAVQELVAARPTDDGGWELHAVRRGRLVGAAVSPRGAAPRPYVEAMLATAELVPAWAGGPAPVALPEETLLVSRWLALPGVRLVEASSPLSSPARGAAGLGSWLGGEARSGFGGA